MYKSKSGKSKCAIGFAAAVVTSFLSFICSPAGLASPARYQIEGASIMCDHNAVTLRGVNAMHIFGGNDPDLVNWSGIGIVREFVGDLEHAPLQGDAYRDSSHNWTLHPLQQLVNNNRERGIVAILCPFGWDGQKSSEFTGCKPRSAAWYASYKSCMREWASHFKGQSDVWIEVMNEPFQKLQTESDDEDWLATMKDMVDNLRSAGFDGVIVVPGDAWGQDESVIERVGARLIKDRPNLLFDVHVYDQWLNHPDSIEHRCEQIKSSRLPFVFAELGPGASQSHVCDPRPFIEAARKNNFSVLGWGWGTYGPRQPINLQTNAGGPNDVGNFNWGSSFKAFLAGSSGRQSERVVSRVDNRPQLQTADDRRVNVSERQDNVPSSRVLTIVESEDATNKKNCEVSDQPSAFCGSGTLHFQQDSGFAQWSVQVPTAGHHLAAIKYCNQGDSNVRAKLSVNGIEHELRLASSAAHVPSAWPTWYQEASKENWQFAAMPVQLNAGLNEISVATESGAEQLSLDNIAFTLDKYPQPPQPVIDARARGAKGDGSALDTAALQNAIDACAGSGGSVVLKNGKFLTGQLRLKSNMTLFIDKNASIICSRESRDYQSDSTGQNTAFILADGVTDLVITGGGVIDGQSDSDQWKGKPDKERPILLETAKAKNVNISNVDLRNSSFWTLMLKDSENVTVNAVNIASLSHPNRDGIDPCDSHHVTITNCSILSDDDALCPKSSTTRGVRDLFAKNVSLTTGANAVKFGTASYGCFDNCRFEDVTITRSGTGISVGIADGAEVNNSSFKKIRMGNVLIPISVLQGAGLRTNYEHHDQLKTLDAAGRVSNILFQDIHASARRQFASCISGVEKGGATYRVENVTLRRVSVENAMGFGGANAPAREFLVQNQALK